MAKKQLMPQGSGNYYLRHPRLLGYLQKANGSWSDSSKESLDLLLDAHFPGSQQAGHPPGGAGEGIELDPLLSDRNMKWSIHSFKPYKSP